MKTTNAANAAATSTRIEGRSIVSAPTRVIQVERVRISERQRMSVASAIRSGKEFGAPSK